MKLFIISVFFIALCIELTEAQREYTFTLDKPFQINVFIPYYSYFTMSLVALPTKDVIVSNTSFITFNLTNGILSSPANDATFYLQNQTGIRYPS